MTSLKFVVVVLLLYGLPCLPLFNKSSFSSTREKLGHVCISVAMESLGSAVGETTPLSRGLVHEGSVKTVGSLTENGVFFLLLVSLGSTFCHTLNSMPAQE